MEFNNLELLHRIESLERGYSDVEVQLNNQTSQLQVLAEPAPAGAQFAHQNFVTNGDFDIDRNKYLYLADVTGTPGVDANVSEECYGWFTSPPDESVEATGAITATDNTLDIVEALFVVGDVGKAIVIEGAGTAGGELLTTIASYTDSTTVELTDPAVTTVTSARVRWRLLTLVEDATDDDDDTNPATNTALKNADHTLYDTTTNDPDWDRPNGFLRIGSSNWACAPFRQNLIRPSKQYINSLIYKLAHALDGQTPASIRVFAGIWDNTEGQQKFLEGLSIELNAEVIGSPGATTSRTYRVIFYTSWGQAIATSSVTVNAPTTFTDEEYVALSWLQPAGIVRTEIYRTTGGTIHLLRNPYPQSSYYDKGSTLRTVVALPDIDSDRPRAYVETTEFNFAPPALAWQRLQINIPIPDDYDSSKTTDKQWYVIGILGGVDLADDSESESESELADDPTRVLLIDQISVDDKLGTFTRSPWDFLAVRGTSAAPTSGDQGTVGGGDPFIPPGGTGGDTPECPVFEMMIEVEKEGRRFEVPAYELIDNNHVYRIVNIQGEAVRYKAEVSPRRQPVQTLKTSNGRDLTASLTHPVFTNLSGSEHKLLSELQKGNLVLTKDGLLLVESNLRQLLPRYTIKFTLHGAEKGFWINGYGCHNRKPDPGELLPFN